MSQRHVVAAVAAIGLLVAGSGRAGPADVVGARAECEGARCRFVVTVRHDDEGWDHYADAWEIVAPDGAVLGTRVLRHPHVEEQPFTRALADVAVPAEIESVRVRARDSVHGLGGREIVIRLER